jgi:hypothetical protein
MEGEEHHKTEGIEKNAPAHTGRTVPNDLTEIDPSELFDPAEFGTKRVSSHAAGGPWGCLWCKKPLATRRAVNEHHARHCSEEIERDNAGWYITPHG